MIRRKWPISGSRPVLFGRKRQGFCRWAMLGMAFLCLIGAPSFAQDVLAPVAAPPGAPAPADPAAPPPAAPKPGNENKAPAKPKEAQKIISNPFVPGGVQMSDQTITRSEVMKLLAEQEARLRKELTSNVNAEEISKLVASATAGTVSNNPEDFIGCVNGVPMYRSDDGTIRLGTAESEEIKIQRCMK